MKGGRKIPASRASLRRKKSSQPDLRDVVSRKEIGAVTINMSGRSGLGLTPKYKVCDLPPSVCHSFSYLCTLH